MPLSETRNVPQHREQRRIMATTVRKGKKANVRRLDIRLTPEDHARLGCVAAAAGVSPSEWVVRQIREHYDRSHRTTMTSLLIEA
jgi:predicted HicB family RNase H-like nuclease